MIAFACRRGRNGVLRRLCLASVIGCALATAAWAQTPGEMHDYAVPAGTLAQSINAIGQSNGVQVIYDAALLKGKTAAPVSGHLTLSQALDKALAESGLTYELVNSGHTVVIRKAPLPHNPKSRPQEFTKSNATKANANAQPTVLSTIAVTGSRIVGAPPASPVIDISQEQMIQAGQTNLGEVIRSIPQNFSGGQNPGVKGGALGTNGNMTGGSTPDLRGIGQDATLTLFNGHRLPFGGYLQSVDISAIPVAAVNRIEIVPDGASAIYGSDAVAGVVNVILKPDYSGVSTTARYGRATNGGDVQRQYSFVGGATWSTGGFIATVDSENDSGITVGQRSYLHNLSDAESLLPTNKTRAAIFSIHQRFGSLVNFSLDALYHRRESNSIGVSGIVYKTDTDITDHVIAPKLIIALPTAWNISISGLYGRDKGGPAEVGVFPNGMIGYYAKTCYCNSVSTIELNSSGPMASLAGGDLRVAFGAGEREEGFNLQNAPDASSSVKAKRHSDYAFAEAFLPFISPEQNIDLIHELFMTGAMRYERYSDFGSVTTPKIGLVYSPTNALTLKASWGKSFKAPSLIQEYQGISVYLFPAAQFGGIGYPSTATALLASGGNKNLKPERATTSTASVFLHPASLDGLQVDLSYFRISYNNRVVVPIPDLLVALNDAYSEFVANAPTVDQQRDLIAMAAAGLANYAGVEYDPSNVVAIVNDRYLNTVSQHIHGLDLLVKYNIDLKGSHLDLDGDVTYLSSRQRVGYASPTVNLAGTVFNPPNYKARLGVTWQRNAITASLFYNFIGGVTNTLALQPTKGKVMQTIDFVALYRARSDLDVSLSIQNITDTQPPFLENALGFVDYDSTNYSAIGRFIGISITKRWQ